jgi:hypothetical protein
VGVVHRQKDVRLPTVILILDTKFGEVYRDVVDVWLRSITEEREGSKGVYC